MNTIAKSLSSNKFVLRGICDVISKRTRLLSGNHTSHVRGFSCCQASFGRGVVQDGENPRKIANKEWLKRLTPEQFTVCREQGTEMPFSGKYVNNHDQGVYTCVCCGAELFNSAAKFDSGSGWPSFYEAHGQTGDGKGVNVMTRSDSSVGMSRVEVLCSKCDSHLGHVFDDGPPPTGKRYCINSESLDFEPAEKS